jgi:DNA-nicking Smr family endonuclease
VKRRLLSPEERAIWALVARTVRPRPGRSAHKADTVAAEPAKSRSKAVKPATPPVSGKDAPPKRRPPNATDLSAAVEPNRKRRLERERDPIEGRIDLHGMGRFDAEDRLKAFLRGSQALDRRAVLVVTGKGPGGDGVIRRLTPEWLADPALRDVVAGFSLAHRRHGGEGALYVVLKRRSRA